MRISILLFSSFFAFILMFSETVLAQKNSKDIDVLSVNNGQEFCGPIGKELTTLDKQAFRKAQRTLSGTEFFSARGDDAEYDCDNFGICECFGAGDCFLMANDGVCKGSVTCGLLSCTCEKKD